HCRIANRRNTLVGLQPGGHLPGQERLPLVGVALAVARRRLVPVAVETGLAADGHDHRKAGLVVLLEGRGVDVPTGEVVVGAEPVEQVDRVLSAALELDLDVAAHRRRWHLQVFHRKTRSRERPRGRRAAYGTDETGQQGSPYSRDS